MTVTNDGATILKSVYVDNPAAKVLVGKNLKKKIRTHGQKAAHTSRYNYCLEGFGW